MSIKRSEVMTYFINEYYDGDTNLVSDMTGYTSQQINNWLKGDREPQRKTLEYLIHCSIAPEFKVVVEFALFNPLENVRPQLSKILSGHQENPGIYAFYDSMGNLLYIGKATRLLDEMYQSIRCNIQIEFPRGIKQQPEKRFEVIRYISAYDVGWSDLVDYPRHVESLILRISKPPLNSRIGYLECLELGEG